MTPAEFAARVVVPGCELLPEIDSREARVLLTATGLQESGARSRIQIPGGQARGFFQCEKNGAVLNVLTSERAAPYFRRVCTLLEIPPSLDAVFEAIAWNDLLAAALARLEYWLVPAPLPPIGDGFGAWHYYADTWKPGKPRPADWPANYHAAANLV